MEFGLGIFLTPETPSPTEVARLTEDHGFESLWLTEHTHIPASRETPYPAGEPLPSEYARTHDPFVALAAAAAVTERIKLATGVCLVVERDPIVTAKQVASLDHVSGGRVLFGVGGGWNREEMRNHGTDPRTRFTLLRERVEAMKAIWTQDEASYHGEHVSFDRIWCWPKPVQQPHPPVLVGGNAPRALDRVLRYGDGWMPNVIDDDVLLGQIAELRGRADREIPVTLFAAPTKPERLARYQAAGVDRVVFFLRQEGPGETEARIERIGGAIAALRG
jgi:probable F420-dependent oxidoreductase